MDNVIGHGVIDYIVVFGFIIYAIYAGFTKPHRILYILPACLSFFFFIEVGPRLTPDKLVPAVFIVSTIARRGISYYQNTVRQQSWIILVLLMVISSTIIGSFYTNYYSNYLTSPFVDTRLIIQVIGYFNYMLIFVIVRKECSKIYGVSRLVKSFLITTSILCAYGIYQYFANEFGLPFRGIVYNEGRVGFGGFSNSEDLIFRVNSLANEPKRLTYFLVIGILIILNYFKDIRNKIGFVPLLIALVAHFLVLWWTYSTSIYLAIAVFIVLLLLYSILGNYNSRIVRYILLFVVIGGVVFVKEKDYLNEIYYYRVEEQLNNETIRSEVYGQEFLVNNPAMLVMGLGPGIYNLALAKEYPGKTGIVNNGNFLVPFNSDILTFIYDFGFVGFLILFSPFLRIVIDRNNASNSFAIYIVFMYCVAIVLSGTATLFFLLGAAEGEKNKIQ